MTKWDNEAYQAELRNLTAAELCERLRGEYPGAKYAPETIQAEAARRLEAATVNQAYDEGGKTMILRLMANVEELEAELKKARDLAAETGIMCCIYAEEPDENGQKSFSGTMVDSAAMACVSIAFPLREMCRHRIDEHAQCCRLCGINYEDVQVGIVRD